MPARRGCDFQLVRATGWFSDGVVYLDDDGASRGWIQGTDSGQFDLVSTISHELGHSLGLNDDYINRDSLMFESLRPQEVKSPVKEDVDAIMAEWPNVT